MIYVDNFCRRRSDPLQDLSPMTLTLKKIKINSRNMPKGKILDNLEMRASNEIELELLHNLLPNLLQTSIKIVKFI